MRPLRFSVASCVRPWDSTREACPLHSLDAIDLPLCPGALLSGVLCGELQSSGHARAGFSLVMKLFCGEFDLKHHLGKGVSFLLSLSVCDSKLRPLSGTFHPPFAQLAPAANSTQAVTRLWQRG